MSAFSHHTEQKKIEIEANYASDRPLTKMFECYKPQKGVLLN